MITILDDIELFEPCRSRQVVKLDRLLVGYDFIIVTGDKESRYDHILNKLITIPPNAKNEWFDRLQKGKQLISHSRNRSECVFYDHSSEEMLVLLDHVDGDGASQTPSMPKYQLLVNMLCNLFIMLCWICQEVNDSIRIFLKAFLGW